jgi:hypothetical protein
MSYTQSVKEGLTPPAYSPAYEEVLREAGIYMDEEVEQTISHPSQVLCQVLLNSFFPPPTSSLFAGRSFLLTLDEARHENEARVQRDITPLLVPCASLLYLHDRILPCRHLSANIQSEWTRVKPLAGPLPVPDYVVGLKRATFTHNEILALHYYSASNKPAMFRDGLYFPFLVCEVRINRLLNIRFTDNCLKVKRGENGLSIAERQSMHVASVAMNAIMELFKDRAVSQVKELDGEILVFSISHDHETVRIYGHYPRIQGDQIHLHRHLIRGFLLRDQDGKEKWTTYHLVRKMYDHFAPIHLNRIRGAIAKLPVPSGWEPASEDLDSNPGESEPQEMAEDSLSSAGTSPAKKPRLKPTAILQGEVDWLKKEREEMKKLNMKEREERQQVASQLERQREDHKQEIERLRQDFKEQMDQLVQRLPRR